MRGSFGSTEAWLLAAAIALSAPTPAFAADVHSSSGVLSGDGTVLAIEGEDNDLGNNNTNTPFPNPPGNPLLGGFINILPPFTGNPPNYAFLLKSFNTGDPLDIGVNMLETGSTTEFIFGGVTRTLLAAAGPPVFVSR